MSFEQMTLQQRVTAVNMDIMRHKDFVRLSGHVCMGESKVVDIPTAMTDGVDAYYGTQFIATMTRKQLRYVVLHENLHKALKHCLLYVDAHDHNPFAFGMAIDYVVNGMIEDMDPEFKFVERPTQVPPLVDKKYSGMSLPQVFNDLNKQYPPPPKKGGGKGEAGDGSGKPGTQTMDEHKRGRFDKDAEGRKKVEQAIDDANHQGELMAQQMAGNGKGGRSILDKATERRTDWREPLRDFIQSTCAGYDNSRFVPPNRRLLPLGYIMPSHFSETIGELLIACDTSGSMTGFYPVVFGEIARIVQTVRPERVRILWWDSAVCGDQVFTPDDYDQIANVLKPEGGGGTTPTCVPHYMRVNHIEPVAVVWLSDGYLFCEDPPMPVPSIWGVVENSSFVPRHGKVLHIHV